MNQLSPISFENTLSGSASENSQANDLDQAIAALRKIQDEQVAFTKSAEAKNEDVYERRMIHLCKQEDKAYCRIAKCRAQSLSDLSKKLAIMFEAQGHSPVPSCAKTSAASDASEKALVAAVEADAARLLVDKTVQSIDDPLIAISRKVAQIAQSRLEIDELLTELTRLPRNAMVPGAPERDVCAEFLLKEVEFDLYDEMETARQQVGTLRAQSIAGALTQVVEIGAIMEVFPIGHTGSDAHQTAHAARLVERMLASIASALIPHSEVSYQELGGNLRWHEDRIHRGTAEWNMQTIGRARRAISSKASDDARAMVS